MQKAGCTLVSERKSIFTVSAIKMLHDKAFYTNSMLTLTVIGYFIRIE